METTKNHYETLGISNTASKDEIKKAFRQLSLQYHPDKNPNSIDKFKEINEAYQTLSDPKKKRHYDMISSNPFLNSSMGGLHNMDDILNDEHINDMLSQMFGSMAAMPGQSHHVRSNPFSPFMSSFFNMPPHMSPNVKMTSSRNFNRSEFNNEPPVNDSHLDKDKDEEIEIVHIMKNITITFKQAFEGVNLPVNVERYIYNNKQSKIIENETLYLDIPQGIDNDEIIEIVNKGHNYSHNISSNVKVKINIQPDEIFKRNGLDIIYHKTITLKDALCGFNFTLPYINGKTYNITNTRGNIIQPGYIKEINNMGFNRNNNRGKLCIQFNILFPESFDEQTYETLEKCLL